MILIDTSVWIDFFRGRDNAARVAELLEEDSACSHPWILGELVLGHLGRRRSAILRDLARLPQCPVLADQEIVEMIDARRLAGKGIGWVDAHLLGSALVSSAELWSHDRTLRKAAAMIGVAVT